MRVLFLLAALFAPYVANAAAVFAHFMVGNTQYWEVTDWEYNIALAQGVHIDAFALNMAADWAYNDAQVANAFQAAASQGFQLFFSFDYAGNGPWNPNDVINMIVKYGSSSQYYHYNGLPFVSTFEGPANADDWIDIKSATGGLFFIPDWSSVGAGPAVALGNGVADGLFNWAAWAWGDWHMTTYIDKSYTDALDGKPYMMPVSPWFYTNLPGYDKNWMWRGDDLWYDRWQQVWNFDTPPEFIEIISWNDFGESHYIGPLDTKQYDLFTVGEAPFNFADNMPHDGWRMQLPWLIDVYKTGTATVEVESLVAWYRTTGATSCPSGNTTGNTASQLQYEFWPEDIMEDKVFISALLVSAGDAYIEYNGITSLLEWEYSPQDGGEAGLYYTSFDTGGAGSGSDFKVEIRRAGGLLSMPLSVPITTSCEHGIVNFNPVVQYMYIGADSFGPTLKLEDQVCISGWAPAEFADMCSFTCEYGYCPSGACVCTQMGAAKEKPTDGGTPVNGYPADGDQNWSGLCRFACGMGEKYCFPAYCSQTEQPVVIPAVSPFNPPACTGGSGTGVFSDLCEWACGYGYCPITACTCTSIGDLVEPPTAVAGVTATFLPLPDVMAYDDLCTFACSRGHCPDVCSSSNYGCVSGQGDGNYGGLCGFACGRGFCPSPCTCLAEGLADPGTADRLITGWAASGMDEATYGPLCNFTCTHGYCPAPNACVSTLVIDGDLAETIPTLPSIEENYWLDNVTYNAGDFFRYQFDDDPDISLSILYTGSPVAELPTGVVCDDVAEGPDGNFLGCVGETVEWLMLSLMDDPYAITSRDTSGPNHTFVALPEWQANPDCSTHCKLENDATLNSWVSVGEGTYNGRAHSLHYKNTGQSHIYKAHPRSLSEVSEEKRFVPLVLGAAIALSVTTNAVLFSRMESEPNVRGRFSSHNAIVVMNAAADKQLNTCVFATDNETALVDIDPTGYGFMIDQGTAVEVDAAEVDDLTATCDGEKTKTREYIIWPANGNDVDSLRAQLHIFDPDTYESVSLVGDGALFFRAFLTMKQVTAVTINKQTEEVEAKCTDNCEDPLERYIGTIASELNNHPDVIGASKKNETDMSFSIQERDSGWVTQGNAVPELAFVSNPPGAVRNNYIYDESAGEGIIHYIVDGEAIQTALSEFASVTDSAGRTVRDRLVVNLFGKNGFVPPKQTGESHGTRMLSFSAGGTYGVAKKVTPVVALCDFGDDKSWIITALDWIQSDWATRRIAVGSRNMAVVSLSLGIPQSSKGHTSFKKKFRRKLNNLVKDSVFPVCSSGNEGTTSYKMPAIFGNPDDSAFYIPELLVVGAVDNDGNLWGNSNTGSWVVMHAPGVKNTSPYLTISGAESTAQKSGTSNAAAKAAGLSAYFLGLTSLRDEITTPAQLRAFILNAGYIRIEEPAIYNLAP